jgi:hypothetical protein
MCTTFRCASQTQAAVLGGHPRQVSDIQHIAVVVWKFHCIALQKSLKLSVFNTCAILLINGIFMVMQTSQLAINMCPSS